MKQFLLLTLITLVTVAFTAVGTNAQPVTAIRGGARSSTTRATTHSPVSKVIDNGLNSVDNAVAARIAQESIRATEAAAARMAIRERNALLTQAERQGSNARKALDEVRNTSQRPPQLKSTWDDQKNPGVVYLRVDKTAPLNSDKRYYVGKSENIQTYLNRQKQHDYKLNKEKQRDYKQNEKLKYEYLVLGVSQPSKELRFLEKNASASTTASDLRRKSNKALRFLEENAIRAGGGTGKLANRIHSVNDRDYRKMGGRLPKGETKKKK